MTEPGPRHSPLQPEHEALGATPTTVGQWEMPLKYTDPAAEHRAVREAAGLFDLSHMGEIRVTGPEAADYLDHVLISAMSPVTPGKAKYTMVVGEDGGAIDDLIAYRLGEQEFMLVPNSSNANEVHSVLTERIGGFDVRVSDESGETVLIALQGPKSAQLLEGLVGEAERDRLHELRYYSCGRFTVAGSEVLVARTGYTGEDGFEFFVGEDQGRKLWQALLDAGRPEGLLPCGLACRDSLRLEAAMPLYGRELTRTRTPLEAGLGSLIGQGKMNFIGRSKLLNQPEPAQLLVGLRGAGEQVAQGGNAIFDAEGNQVGEVTSGELSPTLGYPIALGYVDRWLATTGTELTVDVDGQREGYRVVAKPFYNRKRRK